MTLSAHFTPLPWTKWVVAKYGLLDEWLDGAVVLDPTAGEGNFLEAFIALALHRGATIRREMLKRLFGIEKEKDFAVNFYSRMRGKYGISFPMENFRTADFIFSKSRMEADIAVGNPPWRNFSDLPHAYKERLKPKFLAYGLVSDTRALLLGSSRADIASLVIAKCLVDNMKKGAKAYFFLPLSILLNDSAHRTFRSYRLGSVEFALKEVHDFRGKSIFDGVAARYGLVEFERDKRHAFPIPYYVFESDRWTRKRALPLLAFDDPLSVFEDDAAAVRICNSFPKIRVPADSKPRQGVNTCGANDVFIFDTFESVDRVTARVGNKAVRAVELPVKYLFPLAAGRNFSQEHPVAGRFILMPYNMRDGRPLEENELQREKKLHKYLLSRKERLQARRGTLINRWMARGYWWALLGVGKYTFAPTKVMWEAYGGRLFRPKIFAGRGRRCWQGNQAMHAYIPCSDLQSAERISRELGRPIVQRYLSSQLMEGTCNWAQPGRISRLLEYTFEQTVL